MATSSQRPFVFLQTRFRQGVQPTTTFDIRLFGAIEIRCDGELLTNFRSQKALVLLAYLICENLAVTRDYLAGLAWPEMEQSQALGLLRRSLHDLSSQLPGCLEIERRTVRYSPTAPASVDIHTLANLLLAPNDMEAWTAAAAFMRAPFLHGIYVDDAPALESWLLREQEHWQQAATRLLQRLIHQHTEASAYSLALLYVQQLLALEPWREEAHRQAMLLLARTGQASAALVQYATCRQNLQDELGVAPDRETELLYVRIKAMAATPPAQLPLTTTRFVGRERELAELRLLLAESHCRLITIIGAGGMGKTRLALEVARSVTSDDKRVFLHGAAFAALASVETADHLVAALAQSLAFTFQAQGDPETQLLNYLKTKELLLLLDDFEHLVSEPVLAFVLKLRKSAPGVKLLITSRTRLNLQGEQLYWMQGLHFPVAPATTPALPMDEITTYSSIQLFLLATQRLLPDYILSADHAPAVTAICQLVHGMPLAIELAAAWMSVLEPSEIATELAHNLDFLSSEEHDLPLRQRSMRAVFDTSWRLLTPPEQSVYQDLSIFRNGFTRQAAEQVAEASLLTLTTLVNKSLIGYDQHGSRYSMHELHRQYAADKLAQTAEAERRVRDQHSAYYCALLRTQADALELIRQPAVRMSIARDYENIAAAWDWATATGQTERLAETIDCLSSFFVRLARVREGAVQLAKTVAKLEELCAAHPTDTHCQYVYAAVLARYGNFVDILGRRAEARSLLQTSLSYFPLPGPAEIDTRALRALILGWLGDTAYGDAAQQYYTQALELSQAVGAARHVAEMLLSQSHTMSTMRSDTHSEAKQLAEDALAIHYRLDDKTGIAWSLHTLARLALQQGDYSTCEQMARQSLAIHQQLEQRDGVAHTLGMLVGAMLLAGEFAEAQNYAQEALAIWLDLGFQGNALAAEFALGVALLHQGDYAAARILAAQSLPSARALGGPEGIATALYVTGKTALAEGQAREAQRCFQESLKYYQDLPLRSDVACTLALVALAAYKLGNQTAARRYLVEAVHITMGMQRYALLLRVLPVAALLLADAGYIEQATTLYAWSARQPFVANSRWLLDLVGQRLEGRLGPLSSFANGASQPSSDPSVWNTIVSQVWTELVTIGWVMGRTHEV